MRIRDGERELEVHGSPMFCRQVLDDLPALVARLRGEAAPTRAAISLPPAAAPFLAAAPEAAAAETGEVPHADAAATGNGHGRAARRATGAPQSLDDQVVAIIRAAKYPIGIAGIRAKLGTDVSGQSVRRILERDQRVVSAGGKPAAYSLR